jgi:hypothetical protein
MEATLRPRDNRITNPAQFLVIDFTPSLRTLWSETNPFHFRGSICYVEVLRPIKDLQNKGSS